MKLQFTAADNDGFTISDSIPEGYSGPLMRGSIYCCARHPSGVVFQQTFPHRRFRLQLSVFDFKDSLKLKFKLPPSFLGSLLVMNGKVPFHFSGLGKLRLRFGQFVLFHNGEQEVEVSTEASGFQQILFISWTEELIGEFSHYFPGLQKLFDSPGDDKPYFLFPPGRNAGIWALEVAAKVREVPREPNLIYLFLENMAREFLFYLLVEGGRPQAPTIKLSVPEKDAFLQLGQLLMDEPGKKFPLARLARELGMNQMKLKQAFKEIYGTGIFKFQLAARMKEAMRLLKETEHPTKLVASLVGYRLTTSFITKFREYYGYPPSKVRKMKRGQG